ncbi:uncharacterized protein CMU_021860 [Cryptosporidium muris RN66]|uniref:Uncharacterized protein n=1 Tax=Cryptosporidium muris (strain RN66) TaxID=441375 RepID=B6AJN1_CRYMR|nr:uncharacterized protein CMU_021860 [Cryptosporidium muris RN66]EEA08422.1 hypothetical protein CMU_021860 [Cryptosporidium muris RN66]|eukprot:XP_002142771.1 hypothetical protein [Cryptosporidium muris RN66]
MSRGSRFMKGSLLVSGICTDGSYVQMISEFDGIVISNINTTDNTFIKAKTIVLQIPVTDNFKILNRITIRSATSPLKVKKSYFVLRSETKEKLTRSIVSAKLKGIGRGVRPEKDVLKNVENITDISTLADKEAQLKHTKGELSLFKGEESILKARLKDIEEEETLRENYSTDNEIIKRDLEIDMNKNNSQRQDYTQVHFNRQVIPNIETPAEILDINSSSPIRDTEKVFETEKVYYIEEYVNATGEHEQINVTNTDKINDILTYQGDTLFEKTSIDHFENKSSCISCYKNNRFNELVSMKDINNTIYRDINTSNSKPKKCRDGLQSKIKCFGRKKRKGRKYGDIDIYSADTEAKNKMMEFLNKRLQESKISENMIGSEESEDQLEKSKLAKDEDYIVYLESIINQQNDLTKVPVLNSSNTPISEEIYEKEIEIVDMTPTVTVVEVKKSSSELFLDDIKSPAKLVVVINKSETSPIYKSELVDETIEVAKPIETVETYEERTDFPSPLDDIKTPPILVVGVPQLSSSPIKSQLTSSISSVSPEKLVTRKMNKNGIVAARVNEIEERMKSNEYNLSPVVNSVHHTSRKLVQLRSPIIEDPESLSTLTVESIKSNTEEYSSSLEDSMHDLPDPISEVSFLDKEDKFNQSNLSLKEKLTSEVEMTSFENTSAINNTDAKQGIKPYEIRLDTYNPVTTTSLHNSPVTTVISSHGHPVTTVISPYDHPETTVISSHGHPVTTVISPYDHPETTVISPYDHPETTVTFPHDYPENTTQQSSNLTSIESSILTQSNSLADEKIIDTLISDHSSQKLLLSESTQIESQNFTEQITLHNVPSEKVLVTETNVTSAPLDVNLVVCPSKYQDPVDITVQSNFKNTTVNLAKLDTIQPTKTKKESGTRKLRGMTPRAVLESSKIGQVIVVTSTR